MMPMPREKPDHARALRLELVDARDVCDRLGLLAGRRGVDFTLQPKGATVRCPRHGGVSCSVTSGPDGTVRVRCFGCDFTGDVLALVAEVRGLSVRADFPLVLREAAELAGAWGIVAELDALEGKKGTPRPATPPRPAPPPRKAPKVLEGPAPLDVDSFDRLAVAMLARCPLDADARCYLEGRKMLDLAVEAEWGALPGTRRGLDELVLALAGELGEDTLRRSGMFRQDGPSRLAWHEHRLLIPWRAPYASSGIHTMQRRILRPLRDGEEIPRYVFPRGPRPPWPYIIASDLEEVNEGTAVAFVEGAPDVLALRWLAHAEGRDVLVLGLPGVEGWRAEWASYAAGRVAVLALDADKAGEGKVGAIVADLSAAASLKRWRPTNGKDWGERLAEVRA